jgi:beta-fructofuranosidase
MLMTARAAQSTDGHPGVVGHARSRDLMRWQAQPPLSRPDAGFWHLEVQQAEVVAGRPVLMFSCLPGEVDDPMPVSVAEDGAILLAGKS